MIFADLLSLPAQPHDAPDAGAFWRAHSRVTSTYRSSIDRAALGGLHSDRLGFAFTAGYSAALDALDRTGHASTQMGALCATEAGGNHPRALLTHLEDGQLVGEKTFVTLGTRAEILWVVFRDGLDAEGRPRLKVARIPASREGVIITALPELPFVPEIPHAELRLERVNLEPGEALEGDGYLRVLKPFRTLEDLHVHAALLGYLIGVGRRSGWPRSELQALLAPLAGLKALADEPPLDSGTHVALGAVLEESRQLLARIAPLWAQVDEATRSRWERDQPLLKVAGKAREARLAAAWESLSPNAP